MKVGILGAGQLARMLALAAYPIGVQTLCFDPAPDACAAAVTRVIQADFNDYESLCTFAEQVDLITFETENIPLAAAEFVNQIKPIYPSLNALKTGQDRSLEKNLFKSLGIPTPQFAEINSAADLKNALARIGCPAVLKTRRFGYDGKGQVILKRPEDSEAAWNTLGGQPAILEQFIEFEREISLIAVRDAQGNLLFYPCVENQHRAGILHLSRAPFIDATLQQQAEHYVEAILTKLDYVGVFVIELFQIGTQLFANEMAPRVHNSGHWTIEGAATSQFLQHLRAICGLPLGSTALNGYSAMLNIIGIEPALEKILSIPLAHYHSYGKSPRPQRKLGHITLTSGDKSLVEKGILELEALLS